VHKLRVCYVSGVEELSACFDVAVIGTDKLNETLSVMLHLASDVSSLIVSNCIMWSTLLVMLSR
jgi:Fe-S cluster assembly scaffold protein SufB